MTSSNDISLRQAHCRLTFHVGNTGFRSSLTTLHWSVVSACGRPVVTPSREKTHNTEVANGRTEMRAVTGPDYGRIYDRQGAELQVRIAVLNGDTALGIPVTEAVG